MSNKSKNSGYVILVAVLIMGAVAAASANAVLLLGLGASRSSFAQQQGYLSQSIADACAEIGITKLEADSDYSGETISPFFGGGSCVISVNQPCTDCVIQATGEVGSITRKTKITATVSAGGSLILGRGVFPIPLATLTYTVAGSTGGITVRDDAATPNRPVNVELQVAPSTTPIIRTDDNRVNVGDTVTLRGKTFTLASATNDLNCNCGLTPLRYCVDLTFNGESAGQCNYTGSTGEFSSCSFTVPAAPYGNRNLSGRDRGNWNTTALACQSHKTSLNQIFFVEPKITQIGSSCGGSPKTITISGTGFKDSSIVTILWQNTDTTTTVSTGTKGSFTSNVTFILPATGTQSIGARDANFNYSTNSLTNPC